MIRARLHRHGMLSQPWMGDRGLCWDATMIVHRTQYGGILYFHTTEKSSIALCTLLLRIGDEGWDSEFCPATQAHRTRVYHSFIQRPSHRSIFPSPIFHAFPLCRSASTRQPVTGSVGGSLDPSTPRPLDHCHSVSSG